MGGCVSKKTNENTLTDLITETSDDKYINHIKGQLHLNNKRCSNVDMYLYEDYLYIKRNKYSIKISYYDIDEWSYNKQQNIFTFSTKIMNKINMYSIIIFENQSSKNISEELLDIIRDHIKHVKHVKNIVE